MSREFPQDYLCTQSRKRPSPALAPEISDDESEDLLRRPRAQKTRKLSDGSEDEPMLEPTADTYASAPDSSACFGMVRLGSDDGYITILIPARLWKRCQT